MRFRSLVFLVVLVVVVGVGIAFWRGSGPLPDPEGCTAQLGAQRVDLSTEQAENATLIAAIGVSRGLPARAVSIALATAYQESKIRNLTHGDRDSLGLSSSALPGLGHHDEVLDPHHAINAFYDALAKVPATPRCGSPRPPSGAAIGFPEAYADHARTRGRWRRCSPATAREACSPASCTSPTQPGTAARVTEPAPARVRRPRRHPSAPARTWS